MKRIGLITLVVILSTFVITADAYAAPNRSPKPSHDVAVTNISAPSSCVQGDTVPVVVTVKNQGNCDESFIVTLTDVTNGLKIGSQSVTLSAAGRGGMDETFDSTLTGPTKPGPNEPYTQYGNYLRFGDVNGDGYDDLLVAGASRYNQCQGRAYLYYGGQGIDEKADNTFTGEAIDNYFGEGAALVDVNGDGFDDVILGAWKYNNAQGRVYIYHGSPDMDENADLILDGREGTNDRFGNKICAGDVNNDGYDDLFVNALGWNKRTGRVYLYYGGDPMDTTADLIFNGENEGDIFGCTIDNPKMIGDVNGDGYGDLLITTRFWKAGSGQGRAYLYYGGEGTSMDSIPDKVLTGENGHDEFAVSSCIFDIDNDGFDDVIIGARRWNRNQGRVYVFWGAEDMDLNADLIIDGEPGARAALGGATIDAGYVNNDRYGDILVAAYNYYRGSHTGRAYLFYGDTKASINTACDKTFTLPTDTRNSPQHVALGDLNNDNYPEVAIGGWRFNKGQGRVWLYYNAPPSSAEAKFNWDTTKASTGEHTLKAEVVPVAGEEDTADNSRTITVNVKSKVKEK